jgi:hypothetical protein
MVSDSWFWTFAFGLVNAARRFSCIALMLARSLIGRGLFLAVLQKLLVASISGLKGIHRQPKKRVRPRKETSTDQLQAKQAAASKYLRVRLRPRRLRKRQLRGLLSLSSKLLQPFWLLFLPAFLLLLPNDGESGMCWVISASTSRRKRCIDKHSDWMRAASLSSLLCSWGLIRSNAVMEGLSSSSFRFLLSWIEVWYFRHWSRCSCCRLAPEAKVFWQYRQLTAPPYKLYIS